MFELHSFPSEIQNHIEVNANETNEPSTSLPMLNTMNHSIHTLQPPFAMSFNNNGVSRYRVIFPISHNIC